MHQPTSDTHSASSLNGMAQHFSPPQSLLSPGHFPYNLNTGGSEGGRQSHSPNNSNTHACSYNQCSASFPTLELLEKHEMIQHSSGATNVVSWMIKIFFWVGNKALQLMIRTMENIPFFLINIQFGFSSRSWINSNYADRDRSRYLCW